MMISIPSLLVLGLASAAPSVSAKSSPKVLSLPLVKTVERVDNPTAGSRMRGSFPSGPLKNYQTWYSIELQFGSQQSTATLDIDTGSADLVIPQQVFDPSQSTTFNNLTTPFSDCYVDGTCYSGYIGKDSLWFDGNELKQAQMYVGTNIPDGDNGILGIGWTDYDNFPYVIAAQGLTERAAYSIWLNGPSESGGTIVFGGVDTTKFTGDIGIVRNFGKMSVADDGTQTFSDVPGSFSAALSSLKLRDSTGEAHSVVEGLSYPVIFDTGTTTASLYKDWTVALGVAFGGKWDDNINGVMTTNPPTNGSLIFDFSGVEIELPLKDLFPRATTDDGDYSVDGEAAYWFSFADSGDLSIDNTLILGDTFLRFAYMVYDMGGRQIGVAQAKLGVSTDDSNLLAISDSIPSATTAPNYDAVTGFHTSYEISTLYSLA